MSAKAKVEQRSQREEQLRQAGEATAGRLAKANSNAPGAVFRDTLKDGSNGPQMVVIPAGSFRMGGRLQRNTHTQRYLSRLGKPFGSLRTSGNDHTGYEGAAGTHESRCAFKYSSGCLLHWINDRNRIVLCISAITGNEVHSGNGGMSADQKISQNPDSTTAASPIAV